MKHCLGLSEPKEATQMPMTVVHPFFVEESGFQSLVIGPGVTEYVRALRSHPRSAESASGGVGPSSQCLSESLL